MVVGQAEICPTFLKVVALEHAERYTCLSAVPACSVLDRDEVPLLGVVNTVLLGLLRAGCCLC